MSGVVHDTVIQISGVVSDSVRQSISQVSNQLGILDKKTVATVTKFAAIASTACAVLVVWLLLLLKAGTIISVP